jgi:uncharacterized membrane protein
LVLSEFKSNAVIQQEAKDLMMADWKVICFANFIPILLVGITFFSSPAFTLIYSLVAGNILFFGTYFYALKVARREQLEVSFIYSGFDNAQKYKKVFVAGVIFYEGLFLYWLSGALLLISVPLLILINLYLSQMIFIIADDDSIDVWGAVKRSYKMMKNFKWRYFCLGFRFVPWLVLGGLTLGIALFWVLPYLTVAMAKFYDEVKIHSLKSLSSAYITTEGS